MKRGPYVGKRQLRQIARLVAAVFQCRLDGVQIF
jgi:hypothetical protein